MRSRLFTCLTAAVVLSGLHAPATGSELYRELTGEGRPTLRQLALEGVLAVGHPPALYWAIGVGLLTLLVSLSVVAYREETSAGGSSDRILRTLLDVRLYGVVVALTIIAFRWPLLSRFMLNSDESHAIACAMKLAVDPVFWRGIDGTSGGPLLYYPLLLPKLFGLAIEYGSIRMIGLLTVVGTVLATYGALHRVFRDGVARVAVLPLVVCFSLFTEPDFVHYSSEHVPLLLISLALYFLARWWSDPSPVANRWSLPACGLLLGCLPFAKPQGVPIGLFLAVCGLVLIVYRGRRRRSGSLIALTSFLVSGLLPTGTVVLSLFALGAQRDFWQSYIVNNLGYADRYLLVGYPSLSLGSKLWMVTERAFWTFQLSELVAAIAGFAVIAMLLLVAIARRELVEHGAALLFAAGLLLAAALSVAIPNSLFRHYFLFLPVPITLFGAVWLEALSGALARKARGLAAPLSQWLLVGLFLGATVLYPFSRRLRHQHPVFAQASTEDAVLRTDVARAVLGFASPGEALVVWGWEPWRFVETGLYPGVRDTQTQYQILETPQRSYYLQRFREDLLASVPPVFVDTVGYVEGPLPWQRPVFWDRANHGHDAFPEIGEAVRQHYRLLGEVGTARIYVERQRLREIESGLGRRLPVMAEAALLELVPELLRQRASHGD